MKGIYALIIFTMILSFLLLIRDFNIVEDISTSTSAPVEQYELTAEEIFIMAIKDERRTLAQYELINKVYNSELIFNSLLIEEQSHIDHLLDLFKKYSITVPIDESSSMTVVPNNLKECYTLGILIETTTSRMYTNFLAQTNLPDDIKNIFNHLLESSNIHLLELENIVKYHY